MDLVAKDLQELLGALRSRKARAAQGAAESREKIVLDRFQHAVSDLKNSREMLRGAKDLEQWRSFNSAVEREILRTINIGSASMCILRRDKGRRLLVLPTPDGRLEILRVQANEAWHVGRLSREALLCEIPELDFTEYPVEEQTRWDIRQLIAHLHSDDIALRYVSVRALEMMGPSAYAAAGDLAAMLPANDEQKESVLCHGICAALYKMGARAVPALLAARNSRWAVTRITALEILGMMGPDAKDAVDAAAMSLGDDNPKDAEVTVQDIAMDCLGKIGKAAIPSLESAVLDKRRRQRAALVWLDLDPQAARPRDILIEALVTDGVEAKLYKDVISTLAGQPMPAVALEKVAKTVLSWMNDGSTTMDVMPHITTMARMGPPAVGYLRDTLKDDRRRKSAARALGMMGPVASDAVDDLVGCLRNPGDYQPESFHHEVLNAISRIRPEALLQLLKDQRAKEAVYDVIVKMGERAAPMLFDGLRNLPGESDQQQKDDMVDALFEISGEPLSNAAKQLGDASSSAKLKAKRILVEAGVKAVLPLRVALLFDNLRMEALGLLKKMGPESADAIPELIPLLKGDALLVRRRTVETLGAIGPGAAAALPALRAMQSDSAPSAREAAAVAIRRIDIAGDKQGLRASNEVERHP